ncbi:hypothetical protein BGZ63DRAFT_442909 [Mariannaea sp. PMI_226]|nr:hypothetical protein BGZ63DRAFT_442909 [Mariannaea sp. PMI_226]
MEQQELFDVVVVGGGPVGLAAAYEVAKAGGKVITLEQNNFFNHCGTSGGLARVFQTFYGDSLMTKLAKTSMKHWNDLEQEAGVSLMYMTGMLYFGEKDTLISPLENLDTLEMKYTKLTAAEIERDYPFKNLDPEWAGLLAPNNGMINVQLLVRTLYVLAKNLGAQAEQHTQVERIRPSHSKDSNWEIDVKTYGRAATYFTKKIIITSGAGINSILGPSFGISLDLETRQIATTYFNVDKLANGTAFPRTWLHQSLLGNGRSLIFYGLPPLPWGPPDVERVVVEGTQKIDNPNVNQGRFPISQEIKDANKFMQDHITGVDHTLPPSMMSYRKPNLFDDAFVLDFLPKQYLHEGAEKSIAIFTAGWAMKLVPLLGKALAQMILEGESEFAHEAFSITRKNPKTGKGILLGENKVNDS